MLGGSPPHLVERTFFCFRDQLCRHVGVGLRWQSMFLYDAALLAAVEAVPDTIADVSGCLRPRTAIEESVELELEAYNRCSAGR